MGTIWFTRVPYKKLILYNDTKREKVWMNVLTTDTLTDLSINPRTKYKKRVYVYLINNNWNYLV